MILIDEAKSLYLNESDLEVDLKNNVFAIDATVIDVCLSAFSWAKFRKTKGGVKVHVQLDLKTGYTDFDRLYKIHKAKAFFIIRGKDNLNFSRVSSTPTNKKTAV